MLIGVAIGRNDFTKQASLKNIANSASSGIGRNAVNQTIQSDQPDVTDTSNSSFISSDSSTSHAQSSGYTIKATDGVLLVYNNSSTDNTPYMSVEIDFDSLPQSDRILLQNGIHAENDAQLQQILEDYAG